MSEAKIHVLVGDQPLACLVCGHDGFYPREVKLTTSGMSMMNLEWANKSGTGVICLRCGYVHTFLDAPLVWHDTPGRTEQSP
jgi:predicted nucleic-acid-binding Zn-ribbon protein